MNNLELYLERWHLSNPELLAQSERGDVYTVQRNQEKVVLKLFTPIGAEDEADGAIALQYFDGVSAIRLLDFDEQAHLLEYAGDTELAEWVTDGRDDEATEVIADVLNQLHRPQPDKEIPKLRTVEERFESLFNRAKQDESAGDDSIYRQGAQVAEYLLETEHDKCVLHGDIMHHNIRLHPERGWLSYDAKGIYGERLFDVTNAVCNPATAKALVMSEEGFLRRTEIYADKMNADLNRLRAYIFAYACLSASWPDKPEGSDIQNWFLTVAHNAERHVDVETFN